MECTVQNFDPKTGYFLFLQRIFEEFSMKFVMMVADAEEQQYGNGALPKIALWRYVNTRLRIKEEGKTNH